MHKMYQTLKWLRYSSSSDWSEELLKICSIAPVKHDSCMTYGRSERELETLAITNVKSSFPFHWLRLDLQEYLSIQHIYTWKSPRKSFISVFSTAKVLRTPNPVTFKLETKIKDVLNPFFDAFRSLRRTKSAKLD